MRRLLSRELIRWSCAVATMAAATLFALVPSTATALPTGFWWSTVVSGLSMPMAFAFAPDGRVLVAERAGRLRVVKQGALLSQAALTLSVATNGERGLMSVAIDPEFATNGWVYLYYTTATLPAVNRVSRFTMVGDTAAVASEVIVFEDVASTGGYHNGGWIDIGPDGRLYISTGDAQVPENSSRLDNVKGKILRLERSGAIPPDNPFVGQAGARPEILAYGLRNPFRAAFGPDGRLFVGDVGQDAFEEVNIVSTGGGNNFGWPSTEGATNAAGITSPVYAYVTDPTASITLGAFTTTAVYPAAYRNVLFFGDFMRDTVSVLRESTPGGAVTVEAFDSGRDALVSMRRGPDGYLYVASLFGGAISRLDTVREPTNPTISLSFAPASAKPGELVTLVARVTPGEFPSSTNTSVLADFSLMGGASAQLLRDDGQGGDLAANDGTWTYQTTLPWLGPGTIDVSATATDAEGRRASATTALTVAPVPPTSPPAPDPTLQAIADQCASMFGLQSTPGALFGGITADADGDGRSNQVECVEGSHPRGYFAQYFAEGATGALFDATLSLTNPRPSHVGVCASCDAPAHVQLNFLRADGVVIREHMLIPAATQATVRLSEVPGLERAEFSIDIEADAPVLAERTMSWHAGQRGAHAEHGISTASAAWYFAEGATHNGFELFYLLANTGDEPARVQATYLLPAGQLPITVEYEVAPRSRRTIWVNHERPELAVTDVSAHFTSNRPIIVERAMYLSSPAGGWSAGHAAAGVTSTASTWMFAEGATGDYFNTYLLLANPSPTPADVVVSYLRPGGVAPLLMRYVVGAWERVTIDVERQHPALSDTAVSMTVTVAAGPGIIAERAMWWPGPQSNTWTEAHVSPGASAGDTEWGIGGGSVGGPTAAETYILVANVTERSGVARLTVLTSHGVSWPLDVPMPPQARVSVPVGLWFPGIANETFGATVQAIGPNPVSLVVERSTYSNSAHGRWTAGTNALGTPAPTATATLRITSAGFDQSSLAIARGNRLRVVNQDTVPHVVTAAGCGALEAVGTLAPGESGVSGAFLTAQTCQVGDALQPSNPALSAVINVN